jgi:hypothetical protein
MMLSWSTLAVLQLLAASTVRAMTVAAADKVYLVTGSESLFFHVLSARDACTAYMHRLVDG